MSLFGFSRFLSLSMPRFSSPSRRTLTWLCLGLLFAANSAVHGAEQWLRGQSEHFEMYSSATEDQSRRILVGLEEFRANFLGLFPLHGASEPRTTVVVFESDSGFRRYKPQYKGKPKDVSGYFIPASDEVMIAMTSESHDEDDDPRRVIYHEYVHLLLNTRDAKFPLWLNEGIAEVFSTFKVENGKVEYGQPIANHVLLLRHHSFLPLPQLFNVTHESPDYNEDDRMGSFYAESWALTHFLLFGADKANAARLNQFIGRLRQGAEVESSFREAFGTSYQTMETALRRYLEGGDYYKRGAPAVARNIPATFRKASEVERDFALLNLRWRVHGDDAAAAQAFALLEKEPNNPRPHELLAAVAMQSGDSVAALEHWRRAAELNSDNPWVYVQLLKEALAPREGATMIDIRLGADVIEPWRGWANRALTLSPDDSEAIELALTVEALAEKMDVRLINRLQPKVEGMRDPARAFLALAIVHWHAKDFEGTRRILGLVDILPKADSRARATAGALRYRLPQTEAAGEGPGAKATDPTKVDSGKRGISLGTDRVSKAELYLDTLLAQRGTTAPWMKLEPVVAVPGTGQEDPWRRADELRASADGGDADAMYDLAVAHACGAGVELSARLATEWLQKALDHGYKLGNSDLQPRKIEPELVAQYLRSQVTASADTGFPPLDTELKRRISEAAAADERHAPVKLYEMKPRYPDVVRRAGTGGNAVVQFIIRADGVPDQIRAAQFSDRACATAAEECIRGWRFIPTIRDHRPASTLVEVAIAFQPAGATPPPQS
jgi:TonB family protein